MTQEPTEQPAPQQQGTRARQLRLGRGLAALAYNRLMEALQDEKVNITPEALARLVETGSRIESHAALEIPDDGNEASADLERVLVELGLEPTD